MLLAAMRLLIIHTGLSLFHGYNFPRGKAFHSRPKLASCMMTAMRHWTNTVVVLALLVAILVPVSANACLDESLGNAASVTVSLPAGGDGDFGCQCEEGCLCCAHFAPVRPYAEVAILAIVDTEAPLAPASPLECKADTPDRPPRA